MKRGLGTFSYDLMPEGEEDDDMVLRFKMTHQDHLLTVHVLMPGARQMKGMFKITPAQAREMVAYLKVACSEDEEFED